MPQIGLNNVVLMYAQESELEPNPTEEKNNRYFCLNKNSNYTKNLNENIFFRLNWKYKKDKGQYSLKLFVF